MSWLARVFGRGSPSRASPADAGPYVYFRCDGLRHRPCGEPIRVRIDLRNDLNPEFDEDGADRPSGYVCYKDVLGTRCQNMIRLTIHYDAARREIERKAEGATLIAREEYERLLREATPPPEGTPGAP
ncbi:MAG: hypothetical protein M1118_03475 [Chloroflexi bacterium]|nr:hypothetical protein [Chloroflexota bacterium]